MDVQTPLICAGVVAVSAAVVYLSSVFGIRERTYEEAIEEQRRRSSLEVNVKTSKAEKPKKEKKEKIKKTNKKEKLKDKTSTDLHQSSEQKIDSKDIIPKESVVNRKSDLAVGFKTELEIVILEDEDQSVDTFRPRKSSTDKPIKPILMNKSEQSLDQMQQQINGRPQRNSFDQIHPKDEFELLKDSKKVLDKELHEEVADNEEKSYLNGLTTCATNSYELDSPQIPISEPEIKHEILKVENTDNSSPARKTKKSKQSQLEGNGKEVSAKTIIELVKTVTLNNEEIQLLTDILLNKQSDGSTQWRKKNDPLAVLKKQLQEKEVALEAEMKNLQAAVQKTRELRIEIDNEKAKQLNSREKSQQLQTEVNSLHIKLQQSYETHRSETNAIQKQMQSIQVKCNEERTHVLRLQEENSRLQQLVKNESLLKHDIEQLRNDRQQYELRMTNTQKTNDNLIQKTQQLENRIKLISDSKQNDDTNYQKHIKEVKQELQKCETQRNALVEDLNHTNNKSNSLETENIQMRNRLQELEENKNEEIKRLTDQLSELNKEKQIIENALTEAKHEHQNGDQNSEQEIQKLNIDLAAAKEEVNNLKNAFENQIRNNEELIEKNRLLSESIDNFDKIKNEIIRDANKASEEAIDQLRNESESLKLENQSLNNRLTEALGNRNDYISQLDSIKRELRTILPNLDTNGVDWVSKIEFTFNELLSQRPVHSSSDEQRVEELEALLRTEKEKSSELESKANQFSATLSQTESILSELQNKIEIEENNRKEKELEFESELNSRSTENNKLREKIKALETNLLQIQEFKETIAEMEHKLQELKSKLSGEENEKKLLEAKYDEVSKTRQATKDVSVLREELNDKTKEMETFQNEKIEIDKMKSECEELRASLEKERKSSKELNLQNVRLNSLVKIGHESLKMEEEKVKQLEAQLNLNNGSLSSPVNLSSTNGSPETVPNITSNLNSDNSEEFSSFTNQTQTPLLLTNNKPLKTKRRAASAKK